VSTQIGARSDLRLPPDIGSCRTALATSSRSPRRRRAVPAARKPAGQPGAGEAGIGELARRHVHADIKIALLDGLPDAGRSHRGVRLIRLCRRFHVPAPPRHVGRRATEHPGAERRPSSASS
jgi:hypothetical protein